MTLLKWCAVISVIGYCGIIALMYFGQRSMMYFPERTRTSPANAGFAAAEELTLDTADGERVIAWHVPPQDGKPVHLYFHGNGGALRHRLERFHALTADGSGLVALSYRGYGGSTGRPTTTIAPPGRGNSMIVSQALGEPEHSKTTSAPQPSVSRLTSATRFFSRILTGITPW